MPKVARYEQPRVQTEIVSQPKRSASLPQGSFGEGISQGAGDVATLGLQVADRISTVQAEDALVNFERDKNNAFYSAETGYFNTEGRNAFDGAQDMTKSLEALKKQYGSSLDSMSKRKFDEVADKHIARGNVDIQRHAASGFRAWEVATAQSKVENSIENASLYHNDPDRLKVQRALGESYVISSAEMQGIGAEATNERVQTYNSAFAKSAILAALGESAETGKQSMEDYGDMLEGPDKVKINKAIETKTKVEKSKADSGMAVLTAGNLVDKYETRADMMKEVDKIKDGELRKKTRMEVSAQLAQKDKAEKEFAKDSYHSAIDMVNKGVSATRIEAQDSAVWNGMDATQRNNILSGKHMVTDQALFNQLIALPNSEKAKMDANSFSSRLKPSDLQKITKDFTAAKKGDTTTRLTRLTKKISRITLSVYGDDDEWTDDKGKLTEEGKRANNFLMSVRDEIDDKNAEREAQGKGEITPAEEDEIISSHTQSLVIERSGSILGVEFDWLEGDFNLDLSNAPASDLRALNKIIKSSKDIDVVDLSYAYEGLVERNIPVTIGNLRAAYAQGGK